MVYGLCLLIPIIYFARERFNYKLAFIFFVANLYGPDIVYLISFIDTGVHTIVGFVIMSLFLALVFSYVSRFSLEKSEGKFPLKIEDSGIRDVSWSNAFYATAAGGFSHFFIDQFFHKELTMYILPSFLDFPGLQFTLDEMFAWSGGPYHTMNPLFAIGEIIVVVMLLLSLYYFRKGYKESLKVLVISTVLSVVLMVIVSPEINGGEREYAAVVSILMYVLIPLFLLFYAARNILDNPNKVPDNPKIERKKLLKIVAILSLLLGVIMLLYGIVAITMADMLVGLIGDLAPEPYIASELQGLGIYYAIIASILVIGSIGLFFKSKICRYMAIFGSAYFIIFGFPLAITFFLNEKEVKAMFKRESPD